MNIGLKDHTVECITIAVSEAIVSHADRQVHMHTLARAADSSRPCGQDILRSEQLVRAASTCPKCGKGVKTDTHPHQDWIFGLSWWDKCWLWARCLHCTVHTTRCSFCILQCTQTHCALDRVWDIQCTAHGTLCTVQSGTLKAFVSSVFAGTSSNWANWILKFSETLVFHPFLGHFQSIQGLFHGTLWLENDTNG